MNRTGHVADWRPLHIVLVLAYGVFLTWPALSTGYIPSRDVLIHLLWSTNFTDQLWAGAWYPRWLDQMNGGLGSPVFFFYPPLPYYFTALLKPLFHFDPEGWHQLGAAASLAVILSGLSAYSWLRRLSGATAALVAAIVYMSAPYHLAVDLYQRFAFAELWAFVWLPLVLWGAQATVWGNRRAPLGLTLAYAALVLTHLPTAMIFSPVALAYAIFCAERGRRVRDTVAVAGAMALGTGLAAVYLVPALATQGNVSFSDMREGQFSYVYHFLFYGPRPHADFANMMVQQGKYSAVMMIACVAAFVVGGRVLAKPEMRQARFWMVSAALVFIMMLPIARPVWDMLPPLQAIQFPWRFNTLLTLTLATLVALWVTAIKPGVSWINTLSLVAVCAIVIGQSMPTLATYLALAASPGEASMDKMQAQFGSINEEAREKVLAARSGIDVAEYRPGWASPGFYNTPQVLRASLARMESSVERGEGKVAILSRSPRRMVLAVDMPAEGWVKLPHFYYPGWRAVTGEAATALPVRPSTPEGLLEVKAGRDSQTVVLELVASTAEWIGWGISAFSIGLFGLLAVRVFRKRKPYV